MADDDVGLRELHLVAGNTDAAAGSRLPGNGDVGMVQRELRRQIDGAAGTEEDGARRVVAGAECPAQGALDEGVVRAVIVAGDIVDLRTTVVGHAAAGGEAPIAFGTGEGGEVGAVVVDYRELGINGPVGVELEGILLRRRKLSAVSIFPAYKVVTLLGRGRQGDSGAGVAGNLF